MLDWASPAWGPGNATVQGTIIDDGVDPSPLIQKIASETAETMAVMPLMAPAINSSYSLQFFGPTLQCNDANSSQQDAFDSYMKEFAERNFDTFDLSQIETPPFNVTSGPPHYLLVFLAFSTTFYDKEQPWNNQLVSPLPLSDLLTPQIWVQTANRSIVCVLANASFDVGIEFNNGIQNVHQRRIEVINEVSTSTICEGVACVVESSYCANFLTWSNMLIGNVTIYSNPEDWQLVQDSSKVLTTGLAACDEIAHGWNSSFLQNSTLFDFPNITNLSFGEPWECRNRTIDRGIEDLANNITISMLRSSSLT
jgi:hypothetical protein